MWNWHLIWLFNEKETRMAWWIINYFVHHSFFNVILTRIWYSWFSNPIFRRTVKRERPRHGIENAMEWVKFHWMLPFYPARQSLLFIVVVLHLWQLVAKQKKGFFQFQNSYLYTSLLWARQRHRNIHHEINGSLSFRADAFRFQLQFFSSRAAYSFVSYDKWHMLSSTTIFFFLFFFVGYRCSRRYLGCDCYWHNIQNLRVEPGSNVSHLEKWTTEATNKKVYGLYLDSFSVLFSCFSGLFENGNGEEIS